MLHIPLQQRILHTIAILFCYRSILHGVHELPSVSRIPVEPRSQRRGRLLGMA